MRSRNLGITTALLRLAALSAGLWVTAAGWAQDPTRFEADIQAFERADVANPPPSAPAVFTGSSSIRGWPDLPGAFADYPVLNRGFGGSEMSDLLYYFDRVVAAYEPTLVVAYEGDNDLASGKSVARVVADYETFVARCRSTMPRTGVCLLAVKPSPSRASLLEAQRAVNTALAAMAADDPAVEFVDVFTPMLDNNGQPRPELFQSDMLHMKPAGYDIWEALMLPVLETWLGSGTGNPQPLEFTREPVDQTVEAFRPVSFEAGVSGSPPVTVLWFRDGVTLPGVHSLHLTLDPVTLADDGATFTVSVSNSVSQVTSRTATLHVTPDTTAPALTGAASEDGRTVILTFSERVSVPSATNPANYGFGPGQPAVVSALRGNDGATVTLTLETPITGVFTVAVSGVTDLAGNAIADGSDFQGEVLDPERQPWLIDFGAGGSPTEHAAAPDDPAFVWNNVTAEIGTVPAGRLLDLVNRVGIVTDADLVILRRFNGANESGTEASGTFPANATRDSLFGNTEAFGGLSSVFPAFRIMHLDPTLAYDLAFYASRMSAGDNRETTYTVLGAWTATATLDAANNLSGVAEILGLRPTANGDLTIALAPSDNNNNANHFTYLGVLRLTPRTPELRLGPAVLENGEIRLNWEGTATLEWAPTAIGPWTRLAPSPAPPHTEPVDPSSDRFYRLIREPAD
ncbi:MAG: hypothetical protein H7A46_21820 [Verrucomicrobiales bacterium]|nr:hypothetical protein [Verrucomicrobiales bacterium]